MNADNVKLLARSERLVRLIMRSSERAACALLTDWSAPHTNLPRYVVHRDRANRLREAYADTAALIRELAR